MREIKFRAWTKYNKELDSGFCESHVSDLNDPSYIIEQYTGLKDKNGKEIYEGDILKVDGIDVRVKVIWELGGFNICSVLDTSNYDNEPFENNKKLGWYSDIDLEILGNITKNPELLK